MVFPFLKLPFLVIQMVLKSMSIIDLFVLTCLSKKMKRIVKNRMTDRKLKAIMVFDQHFTLEFHNGVVKDMFIVKGTNGYHTFHKKNFHQTIGKAKDVVSELLVTNDGTELRFVTHWNDMIVGFQELFDALVDIFQISIQELRIFKIEHYYEPIIAWASNLNIEEVKANTVTFGLRHLQSLNAPVLIIHNTFLNDQQLNAFFLDLKANKANKNLKRFSMYVHRPANFDIILDKLEAVEEVLEHEDEDVEEMREWSLELSNGEKCMIKYTTYAIHQRGRRRSGFDVWVARAE